MQLLGQPARAWRKLALFWHVLPFRPAVTDDVPSAGPRRTCFSQTELGINRRSNAMVTRCRCDLFHFEARRVRLRLRSTIRPGDEGTDWTAQGATSLPCGAADSY